MFGVGSGIVMSYPPCTIIFILKQLLGLKFFISSSQGFYKKIAISEMKFDEDLLK